MKTFPSPILRRGFLALVLGVVVMAPVFQSRAGKIDFNHEIRPILSENCYKCHGPDEAARKAKLRLDVRGDALKPTKSGAVPIVPGKPGQSEVIARITATDPDDRMPPLKSGKKLTPGQIESLRAWVAQGAPYATHWAYVKPVRSPLPRVKNTRWAHTPIDQFILARLEREGLRPSPRADRYILARRVSLDLTGLPPSSEEVDRFVRDRSANAYEMLVDRLMDQKAFGEHWARMWLDLARYADSAGYADDPARTIWAYRDYVINSFNANKHFDQFTIEQIAGDLLPDPTDEDLVATAFHRNTMTNSEGGTNDEEFRNAAVIDRVNTTMAVWMATSMGCAQCHTHKYDPISQREYFGFFALLNNTEDADRNDEAPVLELAPKEQLEQRAKWRAELAEVDKTLKAIPPEALTNQVTVSPEVKETQARQAELKKLLAGLKINTVPIMRELAGEKRRKTQLQLRGNYQALGEAVTEMVPAAFHPLPQNETPNRLALAKWLIDDNNPLTARVLANRLWEQIFGIGIVRTSEDFGSQGDAPTHPELLDWLATELMAKKWDMKAFLKMLVTSEAYCQTSRVTPALAERDPDNLLLARGPRFRMPAEVVRDQALAVSGLLSRKMYGPSVRPPQPSLGLTAAFGSSLDWKTSEGEDRYRRALYVEWRRTSPYPSMATFDAPSREVCTIRRPRSNTPLQALVTLNDPVYIEAAQALARRMAQAEGSIDDQARLGFRLCLARPPRGGELRALTSFYESSRREYAAKTDQAKQLVGAASLPDGVDLSSLAAWTAVGNILLNLDETLMKP